MDFATQPETQYTIRFKRGAEDVYGNAIETDYTFTFVTGRIEPWASLPSTGPVYDHQRLPRQYPHRHERHRPNRPSGFALYRIEYQRHRNGDAGLLRYRDDCRGWATIVRAWSQELDAGPTQYGVDEVLLASEEGGKLPPGVYYLQALLPNDSYPQSLALGVVTANLTVKRAPDEMLIWVTDIQTAEPVANTTVSLYRADGTLLGDRHH